MRFKVGDKVRIKDHSYGLCSSKDCAYLDDDMRPFSGMTATIVEVNAKDKWYGINLDEECSAWSDCMLEPVSHSDIIIIN